MKTNTFTILRKFFPTLLCAAAILFAARQASATIQTNLQMQLGNPSGATADPNNHDHYLIQRSVEAIDFSDNLGEPNWASWDLTAGDVGSSGRSSSFFTDTNLPSDFYHVTDGDYTGSGFDRGHMCPSDDRTDTVADNKQVFFMDNIIPQTADNNQGIWEQFETYCRTLASAGDEVLITCGPSVFNGSRISPSGKASIPGYTWKIVVDVPAGSGTALSRITATTRVISINVPNISGIRTTPWSNFVTSAYVIQTNTGFTFFTAVPANIAAVMRAKVDGAPAPGITSFSPGSGSVGSGVTITGTALTGATTVAFNGTSASFTVNSSTSISATVPTGATTGTISVIAPGGQAVSASSFTVSGGGGSAPSVTSFSPTSGVVGTGVTLTGTAFTGATAVKFNGTTASFTVNSDTQITTAVPAGATTGTISVTTAIGTGTSSTSFTVTAGTPAPTVASFSPTSGAVGAAVTLTGTNFTGASAVKFNGTTATFTVNSDTQIATTVPTGATSGTISVTTAAGTGTSVSSFTVTNSGGGTGSVVISQVYGGGGNSGSLYENDFIELYNKGTAAVDLSTYAVQYASATGTTWTETTLSGSIAAGHYYLIQGAAGGAGTLALPTPDATGTINMSATAGKVALTSTTALLTGANPVGGSTVVDFVGFGTTANAFEGSGPAPAPSATTSDLRAGNGATDTDNNAADFTAGTVNPRNSSTGGTPAPSVTSFSPTSGVVGTGVTLTGSAFTGATAVAFNGTSASFTVVSDTSITTTVPTGATTGTISVTTSAGTGTSSSSFTVTVATPPPGITSFSPTSGAVGASVTLTGTNFTGATAVKFNGTTATFTVVSATQITTTVPTGATTGTISVTTAGGTGTSASSFTVIPPPAISSFSPTNGPVGTSVVITGTTFTGATAVAFNGTTASFTVNSATQITATVPAGATSGTISVTTSAGTATSAASFTVIPAPSITSFTPASGPIGTNVVITGANFTGATAVKFNGTNATFTVNSATQITTTVPTGATTGTITVTTPGGTATSATSFTVSGGVGSVVISQVYGGGGNSGATYKNDFIELYNKGTASVDLSTYAVQYASASGTSWSETTLTGTLLPGHYYLIQEAAGTGGTASLPTPEATGTINMSGTAGKVALTKTQTLLTVDNPVGGANVVDFVGFGTADAFEGAGAAPAPSNTTSDLRAGNGATDTNNNSADFATGAVNPRN